MPGIILLLAKDEGFLLEGEFAFLRLGIVIEELVEILERRGEIVVCWYATARWASAEATSLSSG